MALKILAVTTYGSDRQRIRFLVWWPWHVQQWW